MSNVDTPVVDDDDVEIPGDNPGIAQLRAKAKKADGLGDENLDLKRQLAFFKAGIDPDVSKIAKLLYQTWQGDPADIDGLKAEAVDLGILPDPTKVDGEGQEIVSPERQLEDARRQAMAGGFTAGQPAGAAPTDTPHPRHAALEGFHRDIKDGADAEIARADAFAKVIAAGAAGDKRVFWDRDNWARLGAEADRAAGKPSSVL